MRDAIGGPGVSIEREILTRCNEPAFREWMAELLLELCSIDTSPAPDIAAMATRESAVFDIISRELTNTSLPDGRLERVPVSPAIGDHPGFTQLHHTKTPDRPGGLALADAFAGRSNLLFLADGPAGPGPAVNAHIDVVAPFVPPHRTDDRIHGRGAADDKGGVVAIIAAIRILDELVARGDVDLRRDLTAMFVIEEESGGNGSLSLVIDRDLRQRYTSVTMFDTAANRVCPANRGAVWFAATVKRQAIAPPHASPLLAMAWAILEMQREGEIVKAESDHPLFPHRPVQTCNGMLGPFGEHPSRICGEVTCIIATDGCHQRESQLRDAIQRGIDTYVDIYGDRTKEVDPTTGNVKVERHTETATEGDALVVTVYGSTGHMGSLAENDAAITKWAYIVREVALAEHRQGRHPNISLPDWDANPIVLEGGQGFLPTHTINEVRSRMAEAFHRGIAGYNEFAGIDSAALLAEITYEKLNNMAYESDPDSPAVRSMVAAARAVGGNAELRGFDVSCDARLFAHEYPELSVITTGPGELRRAHSDDEYVEIWELQDAAAMGAIFLLHEAGALSAFTDH